MAAVIQIRIETSGSVDAVKKDIADLGRTAESAGGGFSAMKEIATGALRAIGEGAVGLAVKGFQTLSGAISDGIADARQNAQIQAQTAAVLKSTGDAAGVSAQHVMEYASALSDAAGKSLFGDDQIQQSTNLLLTFTNIKGATLDAATAISVDMAQALGGAPKDAAIQLGKALNDPIKGITALTRVGVTFSDEQKAQIQAMQEAGDTAGAQAVILAELNKEFGGSAAAAAEATGGWSEFNGRLGEAKETLGAAVLPLLNMMAGVLLTDVMPAVETAANTFREWMQSLNEGGLGGLLNTIIYSFTGIEGAAWPLIDALDVAHDAVEDLITAFQGGEVFEDSPIAALAPIVQHLGAVFSDARNPVEGFLNVLSEISPMFALVRGIIEAVLPPIQSIVESIFGNIALFIHTHGDDIKAFLQQTWTQIHTIIQLALQLIQATVVPILTFIASFISAHGAEIQAILGNTWNAIKAVIDIALTLIQGVLKAALQAIQGDWSGAWNTIKDMCARIVQDLITVIQSGIGNIVTLFGGLASQVIDALSALPDRAAAIGHDIISGIISGVEGAAGALFDTLRGIASDALSAAKDALGISSPSDVFASEVGAPIVTGLILGVQSMIPNLMGVLDDVALTIIDHAKKVTEQVVDEANKIQDSLLEAAEGIADKLSGVMSDALLGTASLDRAKAKAIGALKDISAAQQDEVQKQLAAASTTAGGFGDPKQAAAFFKMRSDQIFDLAKLRDQIDKTTDEVAKARLIEQYNLIGQAQQAELKAFDTKGPSSALQSITAQLQTLLANPNLPAAFDDPTGVLRGLFAALPQLVAMTGANNPSASSTTNSNQFTYAPTITTTAPISPVHDYPTARALAGV